MSSLANLQMGIDYDFQKRYILYTIVAKGAVNPPAVKVWNIMPCQSTSFMVLIYYLWMQKIFDVTVHMQTC